MKKISKYLVLLMSLITLSGCGNKTTIKESRTIILDVDSEVVPNFSSNFGSGSYNTTSKKYTHTIDYIKDLYIFLTYDDLKTVTVHIPTIDMNEKTITRTVEFGQKLDVEVEVTVEGVKTLEGLQILNNLNYSNLKIGKKNTFKLTLPSRDSEYNIKFTLPQYKEFDISLAKKDLVSGGVKVSTIALAIDQVYIGFEGNQYEYRIYSQNTNQIVSSGSNYENQSSTQYVVLPNTEGYYVKTSSSSGKSELYKVNENENALFNLGSTSSYQTGYVNVVGAQQHSYYQSKLYNKDTKTLQNNNIIYGSLDSYGILVKSDQEDKWYYLNDLKSHVQKNPENDWDNKYQVNFSEMVEVAFDVTRIDYVTKEIISNEVENDFYYYYDLHAQFNENVFYLDIEEVKEGTVSIDLYSKDNEKIKIISSEIYSYFTGDIFSGTVEYQGRTIPYVFPVFVQDLIYSNGAYSYPNQIIDTDISMLSIKFVDDNGNIQTLGTSDYIMDEDQEVIMGTQVGNSTYFELQAGSTYTFKRMNKEYTFTLSEEDIDAGYVFVMNETIEKVQFKVPKGHYLIASDLEGMEFYPDANGIVSIPKIGNGMIRVSLSNGYATSYSKETDIPDGIIYEFLPFYVIDNLVIEAGENYSSNEIEGTNGIIYYSVNPYDGATIEYLQTNAIRREKNSIDEFYKVNLNEFEYNDEYKAYHYKNFEEMFDHIVEFEYEYLIDELTWSDNYYKATYYDRRIGNFITKVYLINGTTISYGYEGDKDEYTFTNSDNKNLKITLHYDGMLHQIIVEQVNN